MQILRKFTLMNCVVYKTESCEDIYAQKFCNIREKMHAHEQRKDKSLSEFM